jgi:hypothetical protein
MNSSYLSGLGSTINVFKTSLMRSSTALENPQTAMPVRPEVEAEIYQDVVHIANKGFRSVMDLPTGIFRANSILAGANIQKTYFDTISPLFDNLEDNYDHLVESIKTNDPNAKEKMKGITNLINNAYHKMSIIEKDLDQNISSIEKKSNNVLENIKSKKTTIQAARSDTKALLYEEYSKALFNLSSDFGIELCNTEPDGTEPALVIAKNFAYQPDANNLGGKKVFEAKSDMKASIEKQKFHELYNLEDVQGKFGALKYMKSFVENLKDKLQKESQNLVVSTNLLLAKKLIIDGPNESEGWAKLKAHGWLEIGNKDDGMLVKANNEINKKSYLQGEVGSMKFQIYNSVPMGLASFNITDVNHKALSELNLRENDVTSKNNVNVSFKNATFSDMEKGLRNLYEEVASSIQKSAAHVENSEMQFTQEASKRESVIQNYIYNEFQRIKYIELIMPQIINSLNKIDDAIYSAFRSLN